MGPKTRSRQSRRVAGAADLVSGYVVSVDGTMMRVKNFGVARSVVAEAITNLMARDPESVARHAVAVNLYFETGAAEHLLIARGSWNGTMTVDGKPVPLAITKKRRRWEY